MPAAHTAGLTGISSASHLLFQACIRIRCPGLCVVCRPRSSWIVPADTSCRSTRRARGLGLVFTRPEPVSLKDSLEFLHGRCEELLLFRLAPPNPETKPMPLWLSIDSLAFPPHLFGHSSKTSFLSQGGYSTIAGSGTEVSHNTGVFAYSKRSTKAASQTSIGWSAKLAARWSASVRRCLQSPSAVRFMGEHRVCIILDSALIIPPRCAAQRWGQQCRHEIGGRLPGRLPHTSVHCIRSAARR